MRRLIAALVLGVVLISGCSVSVNSKPSEPTPTPSTSQKSTTSPDEVFLTVVHKQVPQTTGIDDDALVKFGEQVCTDFRSDTFITDNDLMQYILGVTKGSKGTFSIKDSAVLVATAGYALCPEVLKQPLDDFNKNNALSS